MYVLLLAAWLRSLAVVVSVVGSVDGNASPLFNATLLTFAVPSVASFTGPAVASGSTSGGEVVVIGGV